MNAARTALLSVRQPSAFGRLRPEANVQAATVLPFDSLTSKNSRGLVPIWGCGAAHLHIWTKRTASTMRFVHLYSVRPRDPRRRRAYATHMIPALPLAGFEMAATLATVAHRIFMQRTERCNAIR